MTSETEVELLPVTQADRDEAAALWVWLRSEHRRPDLTADDVARIEQEYRDGKWDHDYTTQSFARHRIASRATDTALAEELRADFAAVQGFIAEVGGTCLGLAMSGSNHPDPDGTLMGLFEKAQALPEPLGRILAVLEGKRA